MRSSIIPLISLTMIAMFDEVLDIRVQTGPCEMFPEKGNCGGLSSISNIISIMYLLYDLFDKRSVIGYNQNQLIRVFRFIIQELFMKHIIVGTCGCTRAKRFIVGILTCDR